MKATYIALSLLCGVGLCADVHIIKNAAELVQFSKDVNSGTSYNGTTVCLSSDIDFSGSFSSEFKPIGLNKKFFLGTFDGQGHTISNLAMNFTGQSGGFFGYSTGTTIRNMIIDGSCSFTSSYNLNPNLGSVIGQCISKNGTCVVENCVNMGNIVFDFEEANNLEIGGIAGRLYSFNEYPVSINNCANYGDITFYGVKGTVYVGGIVGHYTEHLDHGISIQNVANYGFITTYYGSKFVYAGGIAGWSRESTLENCVSAGRITLEHENITIRAGAVSGGVRDGAKLNNCFWTVEVGYEDAAGDGKPVLSKSYLTELDKVVADELNGYPGSTDWSKWIANEKGAKVTFVMNFGKPFTRSESLLMFPAVSASSTLSFSGWFTDSFLTNKFTETAVTEDTSLYALYGVLIPVVYMNTGGTPSKVAKSVTLGNPYGEFPVVEKGDNKLLWWYLLEDDRQVVITEESKVTHPSMHYIYSAWEINTVTFERGDGTIVDTYTVKYNEAITYPRNPKRKGFKFVGWDKDIVETQGADVVITALWKENVGNGGAIAAGIVVPIFVIVLCVIGFVVYKRNSNKRDYNSLDS